MQGRIGHGNASHLHWLEPRHRGDRAGTSDLELHIEHFGQLLHGRKLVGNRPARRTGTEAELALRGQAVDLEHHAIDLIRQVVAARADIAVVLQTLCYAGGMTQLTTDRQTPGLELLEGANMSVSQRRRYLPQAIAAKLQWATGGDFRIQLTQAARRGVARVGEGFAAHLDLRLVQALETGLGHVNLAAHFEHSWPTLALQLEGNVAHGAHVDTDIFTGCAVTTGGALYQLAIAIQQTDGQAIELGLTTVIHRCRPTEQITRG
ncbi:hypothetical protein D3C78_1119350 [compost metagenome]